MTVEKKKNTFGEACPDGMDRRKFLEARMKKYAIEPTALYNPGKALNPLGVTPEINAILGELAGIPMGTIVELCGDSMSGKSTALYYMCGEANRTGRRCAILCPENSMYAKRLKFFDIEIENIDKCEIYDSVPTAEQYLDMLRDMVASGEYRIIGVDSITALVPESEWEKTFGDTSTIGEHARLINRMMRQLLALCSKTGTIVVLVNQFRYASSGMAGGMSKKPGGGEAVALFSHMRLHFKRLNDKKVVDKEGNTIGNYSIVKLVKTRYSQPELETEFPIYYVQGVCDPLISFLAAAASGFTKFLKVVRKNYTYPFTGKVLAKSDDPYLFRDLLLELPVPETAGKTNTSRNALEYIAKELKYSEEQYQMVKTIEPPSNGIIDGFNDTVDPTFVADPTKLFADVELTDEELEDLDKEAAK